MNLTTIITIFHSKVINFCFYLIRELANFYISNQQYINMNHFRSDPIHMIFMVEIVGSVVCAICGVMVFFYEG